MPDLFSNLPDEEPENKPALETDKGQSIILPGVKPEAMARPSLVALNKKIRGSRAGDDHYRLIAFNILSNYNLPGHIASMIQNDIVAALRKMAEIDERLLDVEIERYPYSGAHYSYIASSIVAHYNREHILENGNGVNLAGKLYLDILAALHSIESRPDSAHREQLELMRSRLRAIVSAATGVSIGLGWTDEELLNKVAIILKAEK